MLHLHTHTHHVYAIKRGGVWIVLPSAGINWTCSRKNVLIIVFKRFVFFVFYNGALKPLLHLLWTSWKWTATVCGYGITLMFTLDPARKIRNNRVTINAFKQTLSAGREWCIVCLVIAEVEKKNKASSACCTRLATLVNAVSLIRASVPCKGHFNEMPCLFTLRCVLQHQEQTGSSICRAWLLSGRLWLKWKRIIHWRL